MHFKISKQEKNRTETYRITEPDGNLYANPFIFQMGKLKFNKVNQVGQSHSQLASGLCIRNAWESSASLKVHFSPVGLHSVLLGKLSLVESLGMSFVSWNTMQQAFHSFILVAAKSFVILTDFSTLEFFFSRCLQYFSFHLAVLNFGYNILQNFHFAGSFRR